MLHGCTVGLLHRAQGTQPCTRYLMLSAVSRYIVTNRSSIAHSIVDLKAKSCLWHIFQGCFLPLARLCCKVLLLLRPRGRHNGVKLFLISHHKISVFSFMNWCSSLENRRSALMAFFLHELMQHVILSTPKNIESFESKCDFKRI